eukprot:COSAG02_NODE_34734_length_479_cov_0.707895_1_plen_25_part_10
MSKAFDSSNCTSYLRDSATGWLLLH